MQAGCLLPLAALLWLAWYQLRAVQRPKLDFQATDFNRRIVAMLPRLQHPFSPTFWLCNAHLQLLWLLLREATAPALHYERRDVLTMGDGGTTALHWLGLNEPATAPTLLLLPTITGDASNMRWLVTQLRSLTGWRIVLCERRGHGDLPLTTPRLNTMGSTADLREQLQQIVQTFPASPLYAVGASAGSALLVRYLGEAGSESLIRAGVAYCPGYDIAVAWARAQPFYSRAMAKRLQRYFLKPNAQAFAAAPYFKGFKDCMASADLEDFHQHLHTLAGHASYAEYLQHSNPMSVFKNISVPMLILNAEDDPVCHISNVLEHREAIRQLSNAVLVRTTRGSHCAFFGGWRATSWGLELIRDYLVAAQKLQRGG